MCPQVVELCEESARIPPMKPNGSDHNDLVFDGKIRLKRSGRRRTVGGAAPELAEESDLIRARFVEPSGGAGIPLTVVDLVHEFVPSFRQESTRERQFSASSRERPLLN